MRLNGLAPSVYPLDRSAPRGGAPVPYRESERAAEQANEFTVGPANATSSTYEHLGRPQPSDPVEQTTQVPRDFMPARFEAMMERPLTSRAAQALQSYNTTASFTVDLDAHEVLGLDLYV
ncbi:hypothetical protein [Stutzerimonas stutzeri]|uniref:hypothetical protein n=1 Tax=Stutzerimonas stutzeri TaxID=316 RepID=UPI002657D6A1|nr:hypothetical protein [Stutzerimonas stutzeri]MCF6783481.1 hypothetical protein [Stutzerimonas stutzeri]MCF6806347.1 hypothetical protein [Stutzerimonas stutzeri]